MTSNKTIIQSAEIPSLPHVLQQILSLADHPRTSSADLEKYVQQEPALVAQLLKWVNSAMYALPKRVSAISHAMILLGFSTVKSIASGMILVNTFEDIEGLKPEFISSVWGHTLKEAGVIKVLSRKEDNNKKDELFLAGMIHDVGYLVLAQYFGKKYDALISEKPMPTVEMELKAFSTDHAQIGAELLTEWKFPENVINIVKHHHDLANYEGDKNDIIYLMAAERLTEVDDLGVFLDQPLESVDPEFADWLVQLKLSWPVLQTYKQELLESLEMISQLLVH